VRIPTGWMVGVAPLSRLGPLEKAPTGTIKEFMSWYRSNVARPQKEALARQRAAERAARRAAKQAAAKAERAAIRAARRAARGPTLKELRRQLPHEERRLFRQYWRGGLRGQAAFKRFRQALAELYPGTRGVELRGEVIYRHTTRLAQLEARTNRRLEKISRRIGILENKILRQPHKASEYSAEIGRLMRIEAALKRLSSMLGARYRAVERLYFED